jgi:ATP-dependent helicase/nuclease subunit B
MTPRPRVAHIPPGAAFLDVLAARWLDADSDTGEPGAGEPGAGLILLPTRRAARALAEAFLHVGGGRPMLLPRIIALGALDEVPLALAGALDLPPAVPEAERRAVLAKLVLAAQRVSVEQAWALARELADLMDEAEPEDVDLPTALRRPVPDAYARHWEITRTFLAIATEAFPAWLAEQGLMNPTARRIALLRAQAAAWTERPPTEPVWAAGFSSGPPAVAALLKVVARLPSGRVVLPWLAPVADPDETHPQDAPSRLLAAMDVRPEEVTPWGEPTERARLLGRALLPAPSLDGWRGPAPAPPVGLLRLDTADSREEAVAIAMLLRDAIERPGARAALVTPDRSLAIRVCAELLRWGIIADDSAGEPLADTPPAVLLRLLAEAAATDLAPLPLLALLKHPLAALGLAPAECREAARALEVVALRGARPPPGFTGLRRACKADPEATAFVERLRGAFAPLLRLVPPVEYPPAAMLTALIEAAEAVATTDTEAGDARLWGGEEGEALATLLADSLAALPHLPDQPPRALPGLLDALLEDQVARGRRATRGRDGMEHPAITVWGLLEARLQSADVIVLGGLTEGVWPPATDPGPWMSRQMRRDAGLPSGDAAIGQAAHDFVTAACAAPLAVLSSAARRDGAPAVPSRWLARLDALLAGHRLSLDAHPAAAWARALDLPTRVCAIDAPHPCPPTALRPRQYSVSDIERLIADPYAIYARKILRLVPLDPIEQETDALDIGGVVHAGIERFLRGVGAAWPPDAERHLRQSMEIALLDAGLRPALAAWWTPRLHRIAAWIATEEANRRAAGDPDVVQAEQAGTWDLGRFRLTARADRLEVRADGSLAILDYKTGVAPTGKAVLDGTAPQLPLEAAMAHAGAFGPRFTAPLGELTYWKLSGGREPGEVRTVKADDLAGLPDHVTERVAALLDGFDRPDRPYPHHPHPARKPRFPQYAQLARALELAAADDEE